MPCLRWFQESFRKEGSLYSSSWIVRCTSLNPCASRDTFIRRVQTFDLGEPDPTIGITSSSNLWDMTLDNSWMCQPAEAWTWWNSLANEKAGLLDTRLVHLLSISSPRVAYTSAWSMQPLWPPVHPSDWMHPTFEWNSLGTQKKNNNRQPPGLTNSQMTPPMAALSQWPMHHLPLAFVCQKSVHAPAAGIGDG